MYNSENFKEIALLQEMDNARVCILDAIERYNDRKGDQSKTFIFMLTISSGLERLFKTILCYHKKDKYGVYPTHSKLKKFGHDLIELKEKYEELLTSNGGSAIDEDVLFMKKDKVLNRIIQILSNYAKSARYYNFDFISKGIELDPSSNEQWERMLTEIVIAQPKLNADLMNVPTEAKGREYLDNIIIKTLLRFMRGFTRQITMMHLGGDMARRASAPYLHFLNYKDEELFYKDYE